MSSEKINLHLQMHSGRLWTNIDDAGQVRLHKYLLRNHAFAVHMLCEHPNLKKASTPLENHHDCNCYYDISFILIFTFYVSVLIKRYFDFDIVTYTQNMKQIIWMQNGSFCLWMISKISWTLCNKISGLTLIPQLCMNVIHSNGCFGHI